MFRFIKQGSFRFDTEEEISVEFQEQVQAYVLGLRPVDDVAADEVSDYLRYLQRRALWIACDCLDDEKCWPDGKPPIHKVPVLHVVDGKTLRRQSGRPDHDEKRCDFVKRRKRQAGQEKLPVLIEAAREPRDAPESYGLYRRFTQRGDRYEYLGGTAERRRRFSTHAHLLFTILEKAGLNRWKWNAGRGSRPHQYQQIRTTAADLPISPDISVGDVLVSYPNKADSILQEKIRSNIDGWPANGRPHGFLCGIARVIDGEKITFHDGTAATLLTKPKIFAEGKELVHGNYISLISYAQDAENGLDFPAYSGFAQPCFSDVDCCPVDSSYERRTLEILLRFQQESVATGGPAFDIVKPLFDMTVDLNGVRRTCRPDFVLEIQDGGDTPFLLPIETMGRDDPLYYLSKEETHPRMSALNSERSLVLHDCKMVSTGAINRNNREFEDALGYELNKFR